MTETDPQQSGGSEVPVDRTPNGKPWGLWGTAGFGILVLLVFFAVQTFITIVFSVPLLSEQPDITPEELTKQLGGNGLLIAIATCATGILCTLLILALVWMRRGIGIRDYLALRMPAARSVFAWLGIGIAVVVAIEGIRLLLGQETVPEFMISAYQTAVYKPLFWIALIVAAPLFEELFFRGFLFSGWLNSKLGGMGTIFLTTGVWCLIHLQYDFTELFVVFVYGIVLGLSRWRTGSLITPLVIHCAINLGATLQVALMVGGGLPGS